jgi:hypothetical protein
MTSIQTRYAWCSAHPHPPPKYDNNNNNKIEVSFLFF